MEASNLSQIPSSIRNYVNHPDHYPYVRITWVDYANFVRYRVVPMTNFIKILEHSQPPKPKTSLRGYLSGASEIVTNWHGGIALTKVSVGLVFSERTPGFGPSGEFRYVPDPDSAALLSHADGHISIMGWFEEKEVDFKHFQGYYDNPHTVNDVGKSLFKSPLCPRYALSNVLFNAEMTIAKVRFRIGFETKVIFLSSVNPITPVNDHAWCVSQALPAGSAVAHTVEEIADVLTKNGLLEMYHSGTAPGQYEFVTVPDEPLRACDALIFTRETIRNIASKHGLHATFAPGIFENAGGNGSHVHISLSCYTWYEAEDHYSRPEALPAPYASFLQGLLKHLPSTSIFTLPTPASYSRATNEGMYVAWGVDNREAETPIRVCGRGGDDPNLNFEVTSLDGTANPYLAVAALLSAGMDGARKSSGLTVWMCQVNPDEMTREERERSGVTVRMPRDVEEARDALRESWLMKWGMGVKLVEKYLMMNEMLEKQLEADTPEEAMVKLVKAY